MQLTVARTQRGNVVALVQRANVQRLEGVGEKEGCVPRTRGETSRWSRYECETSTEHCLSCLRLTPLHRRLSWDRTSHTRSVSTLRLRIRTLLLPTRSHSRSSPLLSLGRVCCVCFPVTLWWCCAAFEALRFLDVSGLVSLLVASRF